MATHPAVRNILTLLGRVLFSLIFIVAGIQKLMDFKGSVAYITAAGLPYPEILASIAIIFELGGALMILFGWHAKIGALLILIFALTVSFAIHHFWTFPPAEMQTQMMQFLKNLAIAGGALYILTFGAGGYSLDNKRL